MADHPAAMFITCNSRACEVEACSRPADALGASTSCSTTAAVVPSLPMRSPRRAARGRTNLTGPQRPQVRQSHASPGGKIVSIVADMGRLPGMAHPARRAGFVYLKRRCPSSGRRADQAQLRRAPCSLDTGRPTTLLVCRAGPWHPAAPLAAGEVRCRSLLLSPRGTSHGAHAARRRLRFAVGEAGRPPCTRGPGSRIPP